jgi:fermentation-respiration switch protein FrsA (DUF1100 family)
MIERFTLESRYNRIAGVVHAPEGDGPFPCVILSHGLISSKESSKWVTLAEELAQAGIMACRFDYHGCGESGGVLEETTLTIRLENLDTVMDYLLQDNRVHIGALGLLGSSFGGATSVVKAARDPRVGCVSLWATPCRLEEKDDEAVPEVEFEKTLYEDFARYNILAEASRVSYALVIHGERDEVVPISEGRSIFQNLKKPKKFQMIKGGDHVFSAP